MFSCLSGRIQAASREDLQKKLHSRIDELREKRKLEQSQRDKAAAAARTVSRLLAVTESAEFGTVLKDSIGHRPNKTILIELNSVKILPEFEKKR